jgi:hypothetical protein
VVEHIGVDDRVNGTHVSSVDGLLDVAAERLPVLAR